MFKITEEARARIRHLLKQNNKRYLRLKVGSGGCSGLHYTMALDDKINEKRDKVFSFSKDGEEDFTIILDIKSFIYFSGVEIDYEESIEASKFVFNNPKAKRTCGCGMSFML